MPADWINGLYYHYRHRLWIEVMRSTPRGKIWGKRGMFIRGRYSHPRPHIVRS